jgi:hypothetical protein
LRPGWFLLLFWRKDALMQHFRFAFPGVALVLTAGLALADPPSAEKALAEKLAVQTAMVQAQDHLRQRQPAKAVAVLEAQLARIDGSRAYLMLLRDAYQAYVTDLYLHNQQAEAKKYLERLRILDPSAAATLEAAPMARATVRPAQAVPPVLPASPPPVPLAAQAATSGTPGYVSPLRAGTEPAHPQSRVRAAMADERPLLRDPFGKENELPRLKESAAKPQAGDLLAKAQNEFLRRHYAEANHLFEQAQQLGKHLSADRANEWAYCKLNHVVEELRQGTTPAADLERQVHEALALSTNSKLTEFGRSLLTQIVSRGPSVGVRHYNDGRSGWQVAESAHFRVFHKQTRDFAERMVRVAEQTRLTMSRKWLGTDGGDWQPKCDLYLYDTATEYTQATGVSAASPGHSQIETDPSTGRVVSRRLYLRCDMPGMLEAVLPHETTHVVLAGQFGRRPLPRWVDEGIAVLSEPHEKVSQHRLNLVRASKQHDLFSLQQLMELQEYPEARRITTFYAQSVSLVDFLSRQKGPQTFCQFVRDGMRDGFESALRRHYGYQSYTELEARWDDSVAGLTLAER